LLVTCLFWEKITAVWWLISQINRTWRHATGVLDRRDVPVRCCWIPEEKFKLARERDLLIWRSSHVHDSLAG
jgi:hypothetical protein